MSADETSNPCLVGECAARCLAHQAERLRMLPGPCRARPGVLGDMLGFELGMCPEPLVLCRDPGIQVWASICSAHRGHPGLVCYLHICHYSGVPSPGIFCDHSMCATCVMQKLTSCSSLCCSFQPTQTPPTRRPVCLGVACSTMCRVLPVLQAWMRLCSGGPSSGRP